MYSKSLNTNNYSIGGNQNMPWLDNLDGMARVLSWRGTYKQGFSSTKELQYEVERFFFWISGRLMTEMEKDVEEKDRYFVDCHMYGNDKVTIISDGQAFHSTLSKESFSQVLDIVKKIFDGKPQYSFKTIPIADSLKIVLLLEPLD